MACCHTSLSRETVQRRQLKRSGVHQDEVSPAILVDLVEAFEDAVDIIGDSCSMQAAIGQERIASKIVRPNPHGVNSVVVISIRVECILLCCRIDIFRVRNECVNLINNIWKGSKDWREITVNHVIVAYSSRDRIVVELRASVIRHPSSPRDSSSSR